LNGWRVPQLLGVRPKSGDYRIIYEYGVQPDTVCIFHVRHRREAYR